MEARLITRFKSTSKVFNEILNKKEIMDLFKDVSVTNSYRQPHNAESHTQKLTRKLATKKANKLINLIKC